MTEQDILDNAPKGITHITSDGVHIIDEDGSLSFWNEFSEEWNSMRGYKIYDIRSLSDIKRIAELETDIHNLQRNLEAKDQGRCRTINEMSGMIRNLQEKLKAAQPEWLSDYKNMEDEAMYAIWFEGDWHFAFWSSGCNSWDCAEKGWLNKEDISNYYKLPAPPEDLTND